MLGCSCPLSPAAAQHSRTQSPSPRQRTAQLAAGHACSQLFCPPIPPNQLSRRKQVLCFFPCTPRATALRQARVSGGNLQNCAPSAACGGAMAPRKNRTPVPFVPLLPTKKRRPHQQEAALYLSKKFVYSASATVPRISRGTLLCRSAEAAPKHSTMQ